MSTLGNATSAGPPAGSAPLASHPAAGRASEAARTDAQKIDEVRRKAEEGNPDSLSLNPAKRGQVRDAPYVKPPFIDVSMGRFLTYLSLGLLALGGFYVWRVTVWAADVGGYWNLLTGRRDTLVDVVQEHAAKASAQDEYASVTSASAAGKSGAACPPCDVPDATVESLVLQLADKLGVKPVELNAVIRPLIDPSAPQITTEPEADPNEPGILDVFGEALLD